MNIESHKYIDSGWIGQALRLLIWYSVGMYFLELFTGSSDSRSGIALFLWSERFVAGIFTLEIFYRLYDPRLSVAQLVGFRRWKDNINWEYLKSPLFIIDLLAVAPFWAGFFVPAAALGLVRTLRVLRLLKLIRYNKSMQIFASAIFRSWPFIKSALICMGIVCLFGAAVLYELEPNTFSNIGNAIYFCLTTASTVGFGDISPQTFWGKIATIGILYGPAVFLCASLVGIIGGSYQAVIEEHNEEQKK